MNAISKQWLAKLLFIFVGLQGNCGHATHSCMFDTLLPPTHFTKMLDILMHIAGDLRVIQQGGLHDQDQQLLIDAVAGRVIRLHIIAEQIEQVSSAPFSTTSDDSVYLLYLIDTVIDAYDHLDGDGMVYIAGLLKEIRGNIQNYLLLQA